MPNAARAAGRGSRSSAAMALARRYWFQAAVIVAACLALGSALYGIGDDSLWLDEVSTVRFSTSSLSGLIDTVLDRQINMVLYYLLMKGWIALAGDGETAVRLPSAFANAGAAAAIALLGAALLSRPAGAFAGLLCALNPFVVIYGQEARSYALVLLAAAAASYAFVRWVQTPTVRWAVAWVLLCGVAPYLHLFGTFVPAAHLASLVLLPPDRVRWRLLARMFAALAALGLPLFLGVAVAAGGQLSWLAAPELSDLLFFPNDVTGSDYLGTALSAALLLSLGVAVFRLRHGRSAGAWTAAFPVLLYATPVLTAYAASQLSPVFLGRFLIVSLPGLFLAAAFVVDLLRRERLSFLAVMAVCLVVAGGAWSRELRDDDQFEDWRGASAYVLDRARPGDAIVFYRPYVQPPFAYYADKRSDAPGLLVVPHRGTEAYSVAGDDLPDAGFQGRLPSGGRVWLVVAHVRPGSPALRAIQDTLAAERSLVAIERFAGIQIGFYD